MATLAPAGKALTVAVGSRVAADVSDAIVFGVVLPKRHLKIKAVAGRGRARCARRLR
jgi:hypothetical protein